MQEPKKRVFVGNLWETNGCFRKIVVPQNVMENPFKMDDLGVPPFSETPKWKMKMKWDFFRSELLCFAAENISLGLRNIFQAHLFKGFARDSVTQVMKVFVFAKF